MLSLATFGAGFVTRPIGGIVIGAYSDRVGRKPAMMLSFTMMGCAIIAIALIPSYATIGIAAPVLAVLARMVQGFSLGGEVGPTTAYLLEAAPLKGRGLAVSWQSASQSVAATLGGLVGVGLSTVMAPAALDAYGWRIAFLLGAVTLPFGLWIRRGLPETLHAPDPTGPVSTARTGLGAVRENLRIIVLALIALASGTIATYIFDYITTFAQNTLHISATVAFLAGAIGNVAAIVAVLWGGWLSDRIGRRPVMIWSNLGFLVLILPVFFWIVGNPQHRRPARRQHRAGLREFGERRGVLRRGDRNPAQAHSRRHLRDHLCHLDRFFRRHDAACRHLADPHHRQCAGARLVSVRRHHRGPDRLYADPRKRAGEESGRSRHRLIAFAPIILLIPIARMK